MAADRKSSPLSPEVAAARKSSVAADRKCSLVVKEVAAARKVVVLHAPA